MKAKISEDNTRIYIIPETRKELLRLQKIWRKYDLVKSGSCIHGDGTTQHSIDNSDFLIKVMK